MINHYFQLTAEGGEGLSEALAERVREAILGNDAKGIAGLDLTPAQVEQLSAENDSVLEMIEALERKAPSVTMEINGTKEDEPQPLPASLPPSPGKGPALVRRQSSKSKVIFE